MEWTTSTMEKATFVVSYYKDLEGTIPAEDGDKVALIVDDKTDESLVQNQSVYQPIYREILDGQNGAHLNEKLNYY